MVKTSVALMLIAWLLSGCATAISELHTRSGHSRSAMADTYRVARNFGFGLAQRAYIDRDDVFSAPIPASVRGGTLILTAAADNLAEPGSPDLMSFVVNRNSRIYVAHDTRIKVKPRWLTSSFMDTGSQIEIGSTTLELYTNVYPKRATVTLGANLAANSDGPNDMYSVIVVPAAESQPSRAPTELRIDCATAAVVGLRWTPSTDKIRLAGYRIIRDGETVGTTSNSFFSDTDVVGSTRYSYTVVAFDSAGNTASSPFIIATTPAAGANGDAPVCHSAVIASLTWNWAAGYTQANGSDLWPVTWGIDGNIYTLFGDGGGFGGDDSRGRASFGIARISGAPPPTSASTKNIYGGYQAEHPAEIGGKAGSIIALGFDFYAIAGIFRQSDSSVEYPSKPSSAPNHAEIAYSLGNPYSWRSGAWIFCGADATGKMNISGSFCPMGFVNFGAGNADAPDQYVYMYGNEPAVRWDDGPRTSPARTYLARVLSASILTQSAYEFFAGWDAGGNVMWSADPNRMAAVFTDRNPNQAGCGKSCNMGSTLQEAFYDPQLGRYIGVAQGDYVAQTSLYEAPTPWGPWTVISYNNIDATSGQGGWANLGIAGSSAIGAHIVNAWTSATGLTLWMTYSGGGKAPAGALFPPAGTSLDSFNVVPLELTLATDQ